LRESDPALERYDQEWNAANAESNYVVMAKCLASLLSYIRRKYGSFQPFAERLLPMVEQLEKEADLMDSNEFFKSAPVIANARKLIQESGKQFGSGFHRKPSTDDLREISRLAKPIQLLGDGLKSPDDFDPDADLE
jgi:hypothetical protein